MKKYIYSAIILAAGIFASCNDTDLGGPKNDVEMTATEALAGEWYVHVDGIKNGEICYEDPFGMGDFELLTYNTAANDPTKMFIDDEQNFWAIKGVVNCNITDLTFSASQTNDLYYDDPEDPMAFDVTNGKILLKAAHSPRGYEVDSICFDIVLGDDQYIDYGYWDALRIAGYRRTGFNQGEE